MTALPVIFAEELDADWTTCASKCRLRIRRYTATRDFFGLIYTAASTAVSGYYQQLRRFGGQTRHILLLNAAQEWQVPVTELTTGPSVVIHERTGRKLTYGEIADSANCLTANPGSRRRT